MNDATKIEMDKKKNELSEIYSNDIKKTTIFVKQRYYDAGGKSAKLLAYKLKKQQAKNTIHKINSPKTNCIQYNRKDSNLLKLFVKACVHIL